MSQPHQEEKRIAVVFIHGQGQQRPMEDVQELARTVWEADPKRRGKTWMAPDARLDMADLQRITTEAGKHGVRVDFFEHYWAHFMEGNRLDHFVSWFRELMARPRREAPRSLLPVRQWVIRFMESITLLSILFSLGVSLLTPPPPDGFGVEVLSDAFLGLPVPTPGDVAYILTLLTVALIVAGTIIVIVNDILGGLPRGRPKPTLFGLKAAAVSTAAWIPPALGVGFALAIGIVSALIFQGPLLQWGDLRLPLIFITFLAALLFTLRALNAAVTLAMGASAFALVIAIFGGVSAESLWQYGDHLSPWVIGVQNFLHCKPEAEVCVNLGASALHIFFAMFSFAFLWSAFGVNTYVGAARRWWVRLFWTAIIVAVSWLVAEWHIDTLYQDETTRPLWALYASGVTLAVVTLAGVFVARIAARAFLIPVMADSARYFSRNPDNIAARERIRKSGIQLLDRLHDPEAGYQRIIVVAHSLGTAVGYELLMDYWARQSGYYVIDDSPAAAAALAEVEDAARALNTCVDPNQCGDLQSRYRTAQRAFSRALAAAGPSDVSHGHAPGKAWRITDFITLGSPLAHASLLLADSREDLAAKQATRMLAACPPTLYTDGGELDLHAGGLTFRGWDGKRRPVHSALFAAVRWTNHYFKTGGWIVVGDVIGGPIATPVGDDAHRRRAGDRGDLGRGVLDVEVDRIGTGKLFAHNEYWRSNLATKDLARHLEANEGPQHIQALIDAIDFNDEG